MLSFTFSKLTYNLHIMQELKDFTQTSGFASPAEEYLELGLNLHNLVVKKPAATYFMRMQSDCMRGAGIYKDDIVVIDRSITPSPNHIVVAFYDNEFYLRRLVYHKGHYWLKAEAPLVSPLPIKEELEVCIWGVVTFNLHKQL